MSAAQLRPLEFEDFEVSLQRIRASTNPDHMNRLMEFNAQYGEMG